MKALTIDAYWAWAIIYGTKRIENRTWRTSYRGPLLIHAGKTKTRDADASEWISALHPESLATPEQVEAIRGKIIGCVNMVGCAELSEWQRYPERIVCDELLTPLDTRDTWIEGPFCFQLADPRHLPHIMAAGAMGLWSPSSDVLSMLR